MLGAFPKNASDPTGVAATVTRLLRYHEDTAGALMDPRTIALPEDVKVNEARKRVQREPHDLQYYVYVVDRDGARLPPGRPAR